MYEIKENNESNVYRNLEEQVQFLTDRVEEHYSVDRVIAEFGIRVLGSVTYRTDIPEGDYEYGDAYLVKEPKQSIYVWTRANPAVGKDEPYFLNIGNLAIVGPEGPQGPIGPKGDPGISSQWYVGRATPTNSTSYKANDMFLNSVNGNVYQYSGSIWTYQTNIMGPQGVQGPQGPRGIQGERGPKGDPGPQGPAGGFINIVGILTSSNQLPTPSSINNLTYAYLVEHTGGSDQANDHYDLYIQVGQTSATALWNNVGPFNAATLVTVNGEGQIVWDADTKLDKPAVDPYGRDAVVAIDNNGVQKIIPVGGAGGIPLTNSYAMLNAPSLENFISNSTDTTYTPKKWVLDQIANIDVSGGGSSTGGTTVYVGGSAVETWDADTKLNKPSSTDFYGTGLMRYISSSNTIQKVSTYTFLPDEGKVPVCDSNSCISSSTPVEDYHCATKKYVDDAVANAGGGSSGSSGTKLYKHTITTADGMVEYIFYHYLPNKIYKDPVTNAIDMEDYSLRANPPLAVFYSYIGQPKFCAYNISVNGFNKLYKFENGSFTEIDISNFPTGSSSDTVTEI